MSILFPPAMGSRTRANSNLITVDRHCSFCRLIEMFKRIPLLPSIISLSILAVLACASGWWYLESSTTTSSSGNFSVLCTNPIAKPVLMPTSTPTHASPMDKAMVIQDANDQFLTCLPAVVGDGVGGSETAPIITVFVSRPLTPHEAEEFPTTLDGIPVEVDVTGPARVN